MRKSINSTQVHRHKNPIPHASIIKGLMISSAISGIDNKTGNYPKEKNTQIEEAFNNMHKILKEANADFKDVLKVDLYFNDKSHSRNKLDAVLGSRFLKESKVTDYPFKKLILNRIFNFFVGLIFMNKFNDYTNAFKIYKSETLKSMSPFISESFNIFLEIPLKIISRNYAYEITNINWYGRKKGKAKFRINELKSKYLFTLIYCFLEKNLLKVRKIK